MSTLSIIGLMAIVFGSSAIATISHAQPARTQQETVGEMANSELKTAVVRVTGASADKVEVITTSSVIAVTLVNGNMNDATTVDRENYAAAIAATISKEILGKSEFKGIVSLRVDFVNRKGAASTVNDSIEFREDPSGAFKHHQS